LNKDEVVLSTRSSLFDVYARLRDLIVPGLRYSQHFYERRLGRSLKPDVDWLDLGCGHQVLPSWRGEREGELVSACRSVTGIDYDLPSLQHHRSVRRLVRGDISALPFADGSFDLVTANMVVEHLGDPEQQFREVARVLRPGGSLLLHTPNALGYPTMLGRLVPEKVKGLLIRALDGRTSSDVFPTHYRANTGRRVTEVAERAGLTVVGLEMVATDALFAVIPPLAAIELLAIRLLLTKRLRRFRSDIIAVLQKPKKAGVAAAELPLSTSSSAVSERRIIASPAPPHSSLNYLMPNTVRTGRWSEGMTPRESRTS
jgi:SAM-dependent methyltransferase